MGAPVGRRAGRCGAPLGRPAVPAVPAVPLGFSRRFRHRSRAGVPVGAPDAGTRHRVTGLVDGAGVAKLAISARERGIVRDGKWVKWRVLWLIALVPISASCDRDSVGFKQQQQSYEISVPVRSLVLDSR